MQDINPSWKLRSDAKFSQVPSEQDEGLLSYPSKVATGVELASVHSAMIWTREFGVDAISSCLKRPLTFVLGGHLPSNSPYFIQGLSVYDSYSVPSNRDSAVLTS